MGLILGTGTNAAYLEKTSRVPKWQGAPCEEMVTLSLTPSLTLCRYALHINDLRLQGRWDEKGVYLFYLDLLTDLFHMLV